MGKGFWVKATQTSTWRPITGFYVKKDPSAWTTVADAWIKVKSADDYYGSAWKPFWSSGTNPDKPVEIIAANDSSDRLTLQGKTYHWTPTPTSLQYSFTYIDYNSVETYMTSWTTISNPSYGSSAIYPSTAYVVDPGGTYYAAGKVNTYRFNVRGYTAAGGPYTFNALTQMRVPDKPQLSVAANGNNGVTLTITANITDGPTYALSSYVATNRYIVEAYDGTTYRTASNAGSLVGLGGYGASTQVVTVNISGLSANQTYTFYVTPTTGYSGSTTGNATGYIGNYAYVSYTAPNPPVNSTRPYWQLLSGTAGITGATYRLYGGTWTNNPTQYRYQLELNNQSSNVITTYPSDTTYTTNTYFDYTFNTATSSSVSGKQLANNGADSYYAYATTSVGPFEAALGTFNITSVTKGYPYSSLYGPYRSVSYSWTASSGANTYEYLIESSNDGITWNTAYTPGTGSYALTYANTSLPSSTTSGSTYVVSATYYRFSVRAKSASGNQILYATTIPVYATGTNPTDPTLLSYTAGDTTATISYTATSNPGSNTYSGVQYKVGYYGTWSSGTYTGNVPVTGLTANTYYTIYLRSVNADGLVSDGNASVSFYTLASFNYGTISVSNSYNDTSGLNGSYVVTSGKTLTVSVTGATSGTTFTYQWYKSRDYSGLGPTSQGTGSSQSVSTVGEYYWCVITYSNPNYVLSPSTQTTTSFVVVPDAPTFSLYDNLNNSALLYSVASTYGSAYYGSYNFNSGTNYSIGSSSSPITNSTNTTINGSGSLSVTLYERTYVGGQIGRYFYSWESTTNTLSVQTINYPDAFTYSISQGGSVSTPATPSITRVSGTSNTVLFEIASSKPSDVEQYGINQSGAAFGTRTGTPAQYVSTLNQWDSSANYSSSGFYSYDAISTIEPGSNNSQMTISTTAYGPTRVANANVSTTNNASSWIISYYYYGASSSSVTSYSNGIGTLQASGGTAASPVYLTAYTNSMPVKLLEVTGTLNPTVVITNVAAYNKINQTGGMTAGTAGTNTISSLTKPSSTSGSTTQYYTYYNPLQIPTSLTGSSSYSNKITLNWGGGAGDGYQFYYTAGSTFRPTDSTSSSTYSDFSTTNTSSYDWTPASRGTTYYFFIRSYYGTTTTNWYPATYPGSTGYATLYPPNIPTGLSGTVDSSSQITVSWTAPTTDTTHDSASGYDIYYSTSSTNPSSTTSATTTSTSTSKAITSLSSSTTYYFWVRATNADNTGSSASAWTASINKTTSAPTPTVTTNPSYTGSAVAGNALTVVAGSYSGGTVSSSGFAYSTSSTQYTAGTVTTTAPGASQSSPYTVTLSDAASPAYYYWPYDKIGTSYYNYGTSVKSSIATPNTPSPSASSSGTSTTTTKLNFTITIPAPSSDSTHSPPASYTLYVQAGTSSTGPWSNAATTISTTGGSGSGTSASPWTSPSSSSGYTSGNYTVSGYFQVSGSYTWVRAYVKANNSNGSSAYSTGAVG